MLEGENRQWIVSHDYIRMNPFLLLNVAHSSSLLLISEARAFHQNSDEYILLSCALLRVQSSWKRQRCFLFNCFLTSD